MGLLGGGSPDFTLRMVTMGLIIALMLPMGMAVLAPAAYNGSDPDEVLDGYAEFTGQTASTKISVWPLTGIYTPFTGGSFDPESGQTTTYGYTADGWLYGSSVQAYTPAQYNNTSQAYTVYKADDGVFRYWSDSADYNETAGTGHKGRVVEDGTVTYAGDLYTNVSFDIYQKSDIFFIESSRQEDAQGHFYYDYSGYRMAFQPISNYTAANADGKEIPVIATTTSLSLVWYQYYTQSGITGQLVLSGSSSGVAYLNSASIMAAFNNNTNTAKFDMVFNGVSMGIYIKIDPMMTSSGLTVQDCYDQGYWSIMVTSMSVESNAYLGTDSSMNLFKILETMFNLFTFNMDDYNVSPFIGTLCSIIFVLPLYAALIALGLEHLPILILAGILAAVQAISALWPFRGKITWLTSLTSLKSASSQSSPSS